MNLSRKKSFWNVIKNRAEFYRAIKVIMVILIMVIPFIIAHLYNVKSKYKFFSYVNYDNKWTITTLVCDSTLTFVIYVLFALIVLLITGIRVYSFKLKAIYHLSYLPLTIDELNDLNFNSMEDFVKWYIDFLSYSDLNNLKLFVIPDKDTLKKLDCICKQKYGENHYFDNPFLYEHENDIVLLKSYLEYLHNN